MQSLVRKISSLLGITSAGQATIANSLPVVLASDQIVPVNVTSDASKRSFRVGAINTYEPPVAMLPGTPVTGRVSITIQNNGDSNLFISHQSGNFNVNEAFIVPPNGVMKLNCGTQPVYAKPAGTMDVRIIEEY